MALTHFNADQQEEILEAIEKDGACILDNLLTAELCDQLMSDFTPHIDAAPWQNVNHGTSKGDFFGVKTKRFHGVPAMSALCEDVLTVPLLLDLASAYLKRGTECRALRVSTVELMVLGEGQSNQELHRDADSWAYLPRTMRHNLLFSANIALCDFTPTNGATVVVPGSNHWIDDRQAREDETCLATMKKGSALLYSGDVLHGGGHNQENAIRTGMYVGYIPSWLATLENHAVTSGTEAISQFGERARHLLDVVEGGFTVVP